MMLEGISIEIDKILLEKNLDKVYENMEKLACDPSNLLASSEPKFREIYEITDEDHTVTPFLIYRPSPKR